MSLDSLIKAINKEYGEGSIAKLGEAKAIVGVTEDRMPTGSIALDVVLGGGIPKGRVIEYSGQYSCGKSFISRKNIAACQRNGGTAALIDVERDVNSEVDMQYLRDLGIDTDKLIIVKKSSEEAMDIVILMIESREVDLIVYDSIAMTLPGRVEEKDINKDTMGIEAKRNNLFMRKITSSMQPKNLYDPNDRPWCSVIIINQLREKLDGFSAPAPGGGMGLKFTKGIAVEFKRTEWLGANKQEVIKATMPRYGQKVRFITKKNKTFDPFLMGSLNLFYKDLPDGSIKKGNFDTAHEIFELGVAFEIIKRAGPSYTMPDGTKLKGQVAVKEYIEKDRNENLINLVMEKATKRENLHVIKDETAVEVEDVIEKKEDKKTKSETRK